jgi:D-alanine-D-alanine ligase
MSTPESVGRYAGKRIGVLMGGMSSEREISLRSGANIHRALGSLGLESILIDVGRDIARRLSDEKIDIAFLALHGRFGEDGCIQGLLELMGIPYTGSGVLGSSIGMNKLVTKKILRDSDIPVPDTILFRDHGDEETIRKIKSSIGFPVIVKPNGEGSSVGVELVGSSDELRDRLPGYRKQFPDFFAEQYVNGREITVGLLPGEEDVEVLPILELRPKNAFYDFEAKYTQGKTDFLCPAPIAKHREAKIRDYVKSAYRELHLSGVARIDAMLDQDENPWFLEVNTLPGMTDTSDIPAMAKAAGVSMEEVVLRILDDAKAR